MQGAARRVYIHSAGSIAGGGSPALFCSSSFVLPHFLPLSAIFCAPGLARTYIQLFHKDSQAAAKPTMGGVRELAAARMHVKGVLKQSQVGRAHSCLFGWDTFKEVCIERNDFNFT